MIPKKGDIILQVEYDGRRVILEVMEDISTSSNDKYFYKCKCLHSDWNDGSKISGIYKWWIGKENSSFRSWKKISRDEAMVLLL